MTTPLSILVGFTILTVSPGFCASSAAGQSLPNVVFFFADDLGWADPGRYHENYADGVTQPIPAPVPTPNMNRLCDEGMMFTDAQLPASLCAPNRFCVMSGNYTQRSRPWGTWSRTASSAFNYGNAEDDRIDNPHRTAGTVLQAAGYRTAYFGKMHLGGDFYDSSGAVLRDLPNNGLAQIDFTRKFGNGLLDHGFDYTFVTPDGIQGPLYAYFENDLYRPISDFAAEVDGADVSATSFMRSFVDGDTVGNGLMVADGYGDSEFDTSEHGPILTHFACKFIEEHVANHPDKPFMAYYATPAIHVPLTPSVNGIVAAGATGIGPRADFVYDLDTQLGILLDKLDELGIADNTLVIVTSDNGGAINGGEAQIAAGQDPNGPLNGNKGSIYEAGHRVPFIWRWGDGSADGSIIAPGTICNQLVSVLDWVPSMIDLTGGAVVEDQQYDSVSLLPLLFSKTPDAEEAVRTMHYYHVGDFRGVRMNDADGKWFYKRANGGGVIELFNLATDLGQKTNLVAGFATLGAVPGGHEHKARLNKMDAWFLAHDTTNEPRTEEALDYAPPSGDGTASRLVSVNLTDFATDVQQIDADETFGIAAEESVAGGWVNLNRESSSSDLRNDLGVATTVDLMLTAPNAWVSVNTAYDDTPLKGGIDDYTGTANPTTVTLSDISATFPGGYKAIVYLNGFNTNAGASISNGTSTYYFRADPAPSAPVSLVKTTQTTDLGAGNGPIAQYAVFEGGSDSVSFTLETLYGGGATIGGIQLIGSSASESSNKTSIPVPVGKPGVSLDPSDFSLKIVGIKGDVPYTVFGNKSLSGEWTPLHSIPAGSPETWSAPVTSMGASHFFRVEYPAQIARIALPLPGL